MTVIPILEFLGEILVEVYVAEELVIGERLDNAKPVHGIPQSRFLKKPRLKTLVALGAKVQKTNGVTVGGFE